MSTSSTVRQINELPTPKGHFLLGHLLQFRKARKHAVLKNWVEECGELFRINLVGKEFLVSANHDLNRDVLRSRPDHFKRFSRINSIFEEVGVHGVFTAEGDNWRRHRKVVTEALGLKRIKGYYPLIFDKTNRLLEKWERLEKDQPRINVQHEFMAYAVDVMMSIALGYQLDMINHKGDDFQEDIERIFHMFDKRITSPIPLWRYYKQEKDKKFDKALKTIETVIHQYILEAKKKP